LPISALTPKEEGEWVVGRDLVVDKIEHHTWTDRVDVHVHTADTPATRMPVAEPPPALRLLDAGRGFVSQEELRSAQDKAKAKIADAPRPTQNEVARNLEAIAATARPGGELRGSAADRRTRTLKLLGEFGDGTHAPCVYCGKQLDKGTLTQDKIFTAAQGGRYRMNNLLPACLGCNQSRGDKKLRE
jgi:HNH endonuclease